MHTPLRVSNEIGLILLRKAIEEKPDVLTELNEFEDPGGKIIARLDRCSRCLGTGEGPEGWYICGRCRGEGMVKIS